ncbi:MAG: GNAT family N-acetyltransferase [Blastocatellia bacterium]
MLIEKQIRHQPPTAGIAFREQTPAPRIQSARYKVRVARTAAELDAALQLRFEVFNLELGEGLATSYATGRDEDTYDAACDHLIVEHVDTGKIIGTYRLQTPERAATGRGFYSAVEFDMTTLPGDVIVAALELGRACIAREHRHTETLYMLWKGIAAHALRHGKRYLFGCCSLTSQDPREGWSVMDQLARGGHVHPTLSVTPRTGFECFAAESLGAAATPLAGETKIPKLFRSYLRFGAKVCGPPAIDRQFGTIDYFVLMDLGAMDPQTSKLFFS